MNLDKFKLKKSDPRELRWVTIYLLNFILFIAHLSINGASAFPAGGKFVDGHYLVMQAGKLVPLTPTRFFLSYAHGVIFVLIAIVGMIIIWRIRYKKRTEPVV
jgi:hypothetical protein